MDKDEVEGALLTYVRLPCDWPTIVCPLIWSPLWAEEGRRESLHIADFNEQ